MGYKVAVVGATGAVGREMLATLAEREFPADEVVALASRNSVGKEVSFGEDDILKVGELAAYDFAGTDIAVFSPGASVSDVHAPRAAAAGCGSTCPSRSWTESRSPAPSPPRSPSTRRPTCVPSPGEARGAMRRRTRTSPAPG